MTSRSEKPKKQPKGDWIETESHNKISRRALLHGLPHIILQGNVVISPGVCLRGDLINPAAPSSASSSNPDPSRSKTQPQTRTSITVGHHTFIGPSSVLRPPHISKSGTTQFLPLTIGTHTYVSPSTHISAASIGSHCFIGENVVIGNACILGERVRVLDGTVMPDGMCVPGGVVVGGCPARVVGEVGEGWGEQGRWAGRGNGEGEWFEGGELGGLVEGVR